MTSADRRNEAAGSVFAVTGIFLVVYTTIHVVLNLTNNGSTGIEWDGWRLAVVELAGPITIGLCSSLLILSFGMFLSHGLGAISLAYPKAFPKAFIIFVIGLTVVQIAGHAEIFVNSRESSNSGEKVNFAIVVVASSTYLASFLSLYWLESFYGELYKRLKSQLPKISEEEVESILFLRLLSGLSIAITLTKFAVGAAILSPEEKVYPAGFALLLELGLTGVVIWHYARPKRKERSNTENPSEVPNAD
jgi:heme/copper-type cytochrome/quinol oxidase subunit 4